MGCRLEVLSWSDIDAEGPFVRISTVVLPRRPVRSLLLGAPVLVAVVFLFLGETVAVRLSVAVGALLIAILVKLASEMFSLMRQLEGETSQLRSQMGDSSIRITAITTEIVETQKRFEATGAQTQSLLREMGERMGGLESANSDITGQISRTRQVSEDHIEGLRNEIEEKVDDLTRKLETLIDAQRPVRRHVIRTKLALRELGLRDSLEGLSGGAEAATDDSGQILDGKEPGAGGSMSSNA